MNGVKTESLVESLAKLIHKSLIALGDISRYLSEFDHSTYTAEKYYTMAILLDPEIGSSSLLFDIFSSIDSI